MWNTLSPLADTPMRVCFDRSTLIHGLLKLSLESTLQLGKEPVRHQIVCVWGGGKGEWENSTECEARRSRSCARNHSPAPEHTQI